MYFLKTLTLFTSLLATTLAATIQITQYPSSGAQAGVPTTIGWTGGDGQSTITIYLKQGASTVSTILQRNAQASTFTWTPASTLENGSYELEISQAGVTSDTPAFTLSGGSTSTFSQGTVTSTSSSTSTSTSTPASTTPTTLKSSTSTPISKSSSTTTTTAAVVSTLTTTKTAVATITTPPSKNSTSATLVSGSATSKTTSLSTSGPSPTIKPSNGAAALGSSVVLALGALLAAVYMA